MDKKGILGRAALFGTALIWGTSFVIMKGTLDSVGALWLLAARFGLATLLLAFPALKKSSSMSRSALKGSILMGVCLAVSYILQTYGLVYTTPGKNAFLTATYCVLTPFMAWGIYHRRPGKSNIIAALLCIIGIGFVSLSQGFSEVNIGDILTLLSGVSYALQIILMEQYGGEGDAVCISVVQFAVSAAICLVSALLFERFPQGMDTSALLSIIYLSVMCTALCFFLEAWGMKYTPASTASVIMTLESVFGTMISILFYHEQMTFKLLFGFALIFASVLISVREKKIT